MSSGDQRLKDAQYMRLSAFHLLALSAEGNKTEKYRVSGQVSTRSATI